MSRRAQRDRIEGALEGLGWFERSAAGLDGRGRAGRRTLAGLLADAFAPELARGRDAEEALVRVRAVMRGLPPDAVVPVRRVLDAVYGEEQR